MLVPIFHCFLATSVTTTPGAMGSGNLKPLAATFLLGAPLDPLLVAPFRGGMTELLNQVEPQVKNFAPYTYQVSLTCSLSNLLGKKIIVVGKQITIKV